MTAASDIIDMGQSLEGHAYHYNLPPQYIDESDGVPLVTKYAYRKAQIMVKVAYSITLSADLFVDQNNNSDLKQSIDKENDENETQDDGHAITSLLQKCNRLASLLSSIKDLKFGGVSQRDLCQIVIHLLRLLTATVVYSQNESGTKTVEIQYDRVGYLYDTTQNEILYDGTSEPKESESIDIPEEYLEEEFALPTPAREILLGVLISLLSTDALLRAVSNTSFHTPDESYDYAYNGELLLVIDWKALMRMLSRTAPYLDEYKSGGISKDSLTRQSAILRHTVNVIRYLRKFYDQGLKVKENILTDKTAKEVWGMVKPDLMYETHSNASYRALILLYLFHPSRCSRDFYTSVLPLWLDSWSTTDRCPDSDYLWLTIFCRVRKYLEPEDFDWGPVRARLLTLCGYWLQIPVGGKASDKSFPNTNGAKSRHIPARLKSFIGNGSAYKESVDFVSKLAKLLMFCLGKNDGDSQNKTEIMEDHTSVEDGIVSDGTRDVLRFLSFIAPYYHPSNMGNWTFPLGVLLHYLSYELCRQLGRGVSQKAIAKRYPLLSARICEIEPYKKACSLKDREVVLLIDALLPLCQQSLYSKNERVARAGDSALLYLTQIDHKICPFFLDFATRALDISSVTLSHQAPAALSALAKLVHPSLKGNPSFFLERLPEILRLTLAGIDSNDQDKTIRTLILYRTLFSWIPIGKPESIDCPPSKDQSKGYWSFGKEIPDSIADLSESENYWAELRKLPKNSLLSQAQTFFATTKEEETARLSYLWTEAEYALGDWTLSFLNRIYDIFRAAGEQEKAGKSVGIASRHSSADASQAKHFNMILRQSLFQVFASMDKNNFEIAARSVESFIRNESLPLASKYSSILCEALCAVRSHDKGGYHSPGLDIILPCLTKDMMSKSKTSILYRIRSLAGAVRYSGPCALKYDKEIRSVLMFALDECQEKKIFKAGCKLLRHLLASQCECYPVLTEYSPQLSNGILGKTVPLRNKSVQWHVPVGEQIDYTIKIMKDIVFARLITLCVPLSDGEVTMDLFVWRRCLKILRYSLRGSMSVLHESDWSKIRNEEWSEFYHPNEIFMKRLANSVTSESATFIYEARGILSKFIGLLLAIIAHGAEKVCDGENGNNTNWKRSPESVIASDIKVCKETSLLSTLLSIRRGACTNCEDQTTIWKLQKGLSDDRMSSTVRKEILTVFRKCGRSAPPSTLLYSDGEEAGKPLPRRMTTSRIFLYFHSLARDSSFEIPRRLRRKAKSEKYGKSHIFNTRLSDLTALINSSFHIAGYPDCASEKACNLTLYEAMIDGSFALACHTSIQIRTYGYRLAENLLSRFGWFAKERAARLISSLLLDDSNRNGEYGILSCAEIITDNTVSSRKRLSEVLKGVSNLLQIGKVLKQIISCQEYRLDIAKALSRSQQVISLLPPEEVHKMTYHYHGIFSKLRTRYWSLRRIGANYEENSRHYLELLVGTVRDEGIDDKGTSNELTSVHWRDRLISGWFLLTCLDNEDMMFNEEFVDTLWTSCFNCIEKEAGQPIQKLALGLIGRLCSLSVNDLKCTASILQVKMTDEFFCTKFCKALVYNHREDTSVVGSNKAQWSAGVEAIVKDSQANIASKIIFPFKKMGRISGTLMISHVQLMSTILSLIIDNEKRGLAAQLFLLCAKNLSSSPPSEDQRNELCTSAEIFSGISRALISKASSDHDMLVTWKSILLPFFVDAINIIPISALASYSDAVRYIVQHLTLNQQKPLVNCIIENIKEKLWTRGSEVDESSTSSSDGFAEQSKWIGMMCAILIELDVENDESSYDPWYLSALSKSFESNTTHTQGDIIHFKTFWSDITSRLLPSMLGALGHPYQKCREQIAWCMFCICNCYTKLLQQSKRIGGTKSQCDLVNPGTMILKTLVGLNESSNYSPKELQLCLTTARFFLFYCLHYGDNKFEYASFILPLLPMAFKALRPDDEENEEDADVRMLQAQVIKGYRYTISELGASCFMTYNNSYDISTLLKSLDEITQHDSWQVRHTATHFLRCFQGCHKFLFTEKQAKKNMRIVVKLLSDERKEVSGAAMSALTGILASTLTNEVEALVDKYVKKANNSVIKKKSQLKELDDAALKNEFKRAMNQQTSVYFLCAAVLSRPYDTPKFVPKALAALSKHSYERSAPFAVREAVKFCCREYKRTHMTDNWEEHKQQFTQEQLEALDDVVSTPHYYA